MNRSNPARFSRLSRKSVVFGAALLASAWGCAGGEIQLLGDEEGAGSGNAGSAGARAGSAGSGIAGTGAMAGKGGAAGATAGSAGKGGTSGQGGAAGKSGASGSSGKAGTAGASSGAAGTAGSSSGAAGEAGAAGESGAAGDAGSAGDAGAAGAAGSPLGGAAGAAGTTAGSAGSAGGGNTCTRLEDCPTTADVCLLRTCTTGVCGTTPEAAGVAIAAQTAGDCKAVKCDGNGASVTVNDDTDVPDDKNPCTTDTCVDGVKTFTPVAAGDSCGAPLVCDGNGNCQGCNVGTDCPGTDDECRTRTCTAGVCGASFTAQGTILTAQTAGDCKRRECDGAGAIVDVTLVTDVPDDGKDCTQNTCNGQTGAFPPAASGTACDDDGGKVCDGSGACVACVSEASCPAPTNECQVATCQAGKCGFGNLPLGTKTTTQSDGDCKSKQCDGAGQVVDVNDDADLPDDANACTTDTCVAGVKTHTPLGSGTSCGGTQICNATGQCVGCVNPTTCPQGNECKTATCDGGVCGFALAAPGSATATQTQNDCKKSTCDGAGNVVVVTDDTDLPVDDGKECTTDTCSGGVIQRNPKAANQACTQGGGKFCDGNGACVACNAPAQCGTDTECKKMTCDGNVCGQNNTALGFLVATQTPNDCKKNQCDGNGNIVPANDDLDVPADLNQCTDAVCLNGNGTLPNSPINTSCNQNGGTRCDGNGACVQCTAASQCGTDTLCKTFACNGGTCSQNNVAAGTSVGPQAAGDCRANVCDGSGNLTLDAVDDADVPNDNKQCTTDTCVSGTPTFTPLGAGAACTEGGGKVCSGATAICLGCLGDSDCSGATPTCVGNACVAAVCGDGKKQGAEECDDGNVAGGDGCSTGCAVEAGASCTGGTPSVCCPTATLLFTQYYEEGSNKWLEITNMSKAAVDLAGYTVSIYANSPGNVGWKGGTASGTNFALSGSLASGSNVLVRGTGANVPSYATAALTSGNISFNGNDSVVLWRNNAAFSVAQIADVISVTGSSETFAGDKSFGRISWGTGFSTASGSNINDAADVWATLTLATVNNAASTSNSYLGTYGLPAACKVP